MKYQLDYCEDYPQADWVVLASGLGGHGQFWQPQLAALKQYFHVLSYDQTGTHKDDELLPLNYSMADLAQQVVDLLKQHQIKQFHFIGHALGGHIGIELASLIAPHDLHMLSLTSINAWDELDPHTAKCFQARVRLLKDSGAEAYVRAQALFLYPPAWISQYAQRIQRSEDEQLIHFPPAHNVLMRLNALKAFKVTARHAKALQNTRLHFIANQDDFLVPVQKSYDLQKRLGQGKVTLLGYGAHACTITHTDAVNESLIDFLKRA